MNSACKCFFALLLLMLSVTAAKAQYENVWAFGTRAGIDFNSGSPVAVKDSMRTPEGCASVCGANGQLLFYTEGSQVWGRNHQLMPNGSNLAPLPISMPSISTSGSTTQGAQIVPIPGQAQRYYIFSLTSIEFGNYSGRLYYSVVDMSLNGGMGDIAAGEKGILIDSMLTEKMTAVAGNHCNVWLLARATVPRIKAYSISASGIDLSPVVSNVSQALSGIASAAGVIATSPNRRKVAIGGILQSNGLAVYDFDPASGQLTNELLLNPSSMGVYGLCFSPDNSKLYGSTNNGPGTPFIFQYDLSAGSPAAIAASMTTYPFDFFTQLKLAPDGMIYFASDGTTIGRFRYPNLAGAAALYEPNILTLLDTTYASGGLPNPVPIITGDTLHSSTGITLYCFSDPARLTASDTTGWDYRWSNGATGKSLVTGTPGIYWLNYYTPSCTWHSDTFRLQPMYMPPRTGATAGCYQDSNAMAWAIPAAGDTVTYTYIWQNAAGDTLRGPLQTNSGDTLRQLINGGSYRLHIFTARPGCDTSLSITVPMPGYQAAFTVSDSVICMGDTVFMHHTSATTFSSWLWTFGDGGSATSENTQHIFPHPGQYTVRMIAGTDYPCYDTVYHSITVDSLFTGSFVKDRDRICTGESIHFTPRTDTTALSLQWHFGDSNSLMAAPQAVQHAYDQAGSLPVQLSTSFRACPSNSYIDTVHVYPLPLVNLGPDTGLCLHGAPLLLRNMQAPPAGNYRQLWSTGETTPEIRVVHPGTYSLTVSAAPLGCSTTETIIVHKDCYIDIPNAFTPNDDNVNDFFFPRQLLSRKVTRFRMQLFNRWGQEIFNTTATTGRGWDGRFNGQPQPQGVYIYLIEVTIDGIHEERYEGNVTLIR